MSSSSSSVVVVGSGSGSSSSAVAVAGAGPGAVVVVVVVHNNNYYYSSSSSGRGSRTSSRHATVPTRHALQLLDSMSIGLGICSTFPLSYHLFLGGWRVGVGTTL